MAWGPLIFVFAVIPVIVLLRGIHILKACLHSPIQRLVVIFEVPFVLASMPFILTGLLMWEGSIDSSFYWRSFGLEQPPAFSDLLMFAFDQTIRGAAYDASEVYLLDFTKIYHSCESVLFCTSLFIYRAIVEALMSLFIVAVALTVNRLLFGRGQSKNMAGR